MSKILVAEISGKRPGDSKARATELFDITYDHLIISNNSDGYETDWPIVMVPEDYMAWYKENVKTSDNALFLMGVFSRKDTATAFLLSTLLSALICSMAILRMTSNTG